MPTVTGRAEVRSYISGLPKQLTAVLRGAGRAGGKVIAAEAKSRSTSNEVGDAIIVKSKEHPDRIVVTVTVKPGWTMSRAIWLEHGTSAHFISVDDSQRQGQGIRRINQKVKEAKGDGSLVIGGKFVGATVWHPGASPHPFLRPALDIKGDDAIKAAQGYLNARIVKGRVIAISEDKDE